MQKPKMILFDYGQTLVAEQAFDGLRGTQAVMGYALRNRYGYTAQQVQAEAEQINLDLGRADPETRPLRQVEVPNHMFTSFLYQSMGIELSLTPSQIDRVFWDAASPGKPTEGIEDFLRFLQERGIRTGVISNITYCGEVVCERIHRLLPENHFEFILPSSEYLFRKPHSRIFRLALEKAQLPPEDVWYIGDNYNCDVVGAQAAGLYPVWYTGATEAPPVRTDVLTVNDWDALRALLEQMPDL